MTVDTARICVATTAEMNEELALVKQAKADLLKGGQSYGLGDRRFQGVSFDQLVTREKELERAIGFADGQRFAGALTDVSRAG